MTQAHLRILETTDLHMHLMSFDYATQNDSAALGLANLCPLISQARSGPGLSLLFDNGDFLQGNPLAEHIAAQPASDAPHPMIAALEALDYDAITVGNHEFDYGLDYLQSTLANTTVPVVSANLRLSPQHTLFPAWTVLTRDIPCDDGQTRPIRIGVIGFVTPQIVDWDAHLLGNRLQTEDIVSSARTYLPQLKRAGVDLTVALCHSGISSGPLMDRMENAALHLAALPGVDVVLSGHTHDLFPHPQFDGIADIDVARGTVHGKPTVMAGAYGVALGQIDLTLTHDAGHWQIADHKVDLIYPSAQPAADPVAVTITQNLQTLHQDTLEALRENVTITPRRLTSYLAALGMDRTADLMAAAQSDHVRRALKNTAYADLPLLTATVSFRAGGQSGSTNFSDIAPGPITQADVAAIAPFNNPLCAILMRGWQLRQWLETAAGYFSTISDTGGTGPLLNGQVPHYHFDTLHGLTYRIDLRVPPQSGTGPEGGPFRVTDVAFGGALIEDDMVFVIAASSYRVFGGGSLVNVGAQDVLYTSGEGLTQILGDHLAQHGIPDQRPRPAWSFVPVPGCAVTFDTNPEAASVVQAIGAADQIVAGDVQPNGFQRFTLHL